MRKHMDYYEPVADYKKRFGNKYQARKVRILHQEETNRLHEHPSDEELRIRRSLAKPEICVYAV